MITSTPPIMGDMQTVYVMNSDQRSETDKCLEDESELSDLLQKKIANQAFTQEDSERITNCIEKRRESRGKFAGVFLVSVVILVIALIVGCLVV